LGLRGYEHKNNWYGRLTKIQKPSALIIHKNKRTHNKSNNKLLTNYRTILPVPGVTTSVHPVSEAWDDLH
jgi:hypothetical protein